jgi:hypothetical protein
MDSTWAIFTGHVTLLGTKIKEDKMDWTWSSDGVRD